MNCRWTIPILGVLALLAFACGGEETPPAEGPASETHVSGVDPEVVREFEEAPIPPPAAWAETRLRQTAMADGLFDGLPEADEADAGPELRRAFGEARAAAEANPGRPTTGPFGESYEPTVEELRLAEIGERIHALAAGEAAEGGSERSYRSFREVTVKAFGTGYVVVVEPVERFVRLPPGR